MASRAENHQRSARAAGAAPGEITEVDRRVIRAGAERVDEVVPVAFGAPGCSPDFETEAAFVGWLAQSVAPRGYQKAVEP